MTRCDVIAVFVNMGFSNEDKVLIKSLFELKGYNAHQFMKEFPNKDWNKSSLNRLLKKLRDTGTVNRWPGSGRRRTARTDNQWRSQKLCVGGQARAPPPPFSSPPHPSPPVLFLRSRAPYIQLWGLGSAVSSPSGSGRSPADKRFWVHFELKTALLVIAKFEEYFHETKC